MELPDNEISRVVPEKESWVRFCSNCLKYIDSLVNYDVMDSCVSSCSSGIFMCYKCGFGLGHSLSAHVGSLGVLWPTLADLDAVLLCEYM